MARNMAEVCYLTKLLELARTTEYDPASPIPEASDARPYDPASPTPPNTPREPLCGGYDPEDPGRDADDGEDYDPGAPVAGRDLRSDPPTYWPGSA